MDLSQGKCIGRRSKREQTPGVNHILWNREWKKRLKQNYYMSNYYVPRAVLDVGGTRMTSTQFPSWKYPQCVKM